MRRLMTLFAIATAVASTIVFFPTVRATAGFTLGNIVVYRVGDGSASLGSAATAVFLDEYTTAGGLVQSIPMPTTLIGSNKRLTASGSATTEGFLTRSTDGRYIVLTGYDAALGTAGITTSTSTTVNRVVGRVDSSGSVDTTTGTTAISGGNPRGVASDDGSRFWIVGSNTGVQLATFGASSVTTISTTQTNLREANLFGGQLYATTGAGTAFRVGAVGSGLPTTTGQTTVSLPGLPITGSSNGIFFADLSATVPGLDTLYVADDSANQLQKYSLVGSTWMANGTVAAGTARGLTGIVDGTTVTMFGTTGGTLFKFVDATGYNAMLTGTITTLVTVASNTAIRGVALTPSNSTPPTPTNPTGTGSANPSTVQAGTSTQLTVTVTPGANPTSIGLAVTANLTPIGGPANQAFTAGANNTFTFTAFVPAATSTGPKTITATITDTNTPPRSGTATISLTVTAASTVPTGTGSASPSSLRVGNSTLLTVNVTPGSNPPSIGLGVVGDLSAIGGAAVQQFYDDGTHGDAVPGNNVFSYLAFVPIGTTLGAKSLPITIADTNTPPRSGTTSIAVTVKPPPPPTTIKISQVYGGGGNSGATYTNDFVELFNFGTVPVDIAGWSVQYSSSGATGATAWSGGQGGNLTSVCPSGPCIVEPGHYFLVQESQGAGGTTPLPAADVVGTILMSGTAAKIALVATTDALTGACPSIDDIVDFVGYGGANCAETTPTGGLGNTTAAVRRGNGCIDTNNNANDFIVVGPIPRNSAAPPNICGGDPNEPSGVGIAVPDSIEPAADTLMTVRVAPATTPPSTGVSVVVDLTAIGGSNAQMLFDDGTHGDLAVGDGVFSFLALMPASMTTGAKSFVATITDAQSRTATAPITLTIVSPTCGVERWSVKVGTDSTVGLVNLTPVTFLGPNLPATIENLGLVTPPSDADLSPPLGVFSAARSAPIETTVFTVDATMTFYKKETDVDYHIVLDDGNGHTLISEIPSPACILADGSPRVLVSSPLATGIARARAKFDSHLSAASFFQNAGIPVRVTGVGFFDFEHGQTGVAPNAIELHPVLDISFRGNTSTALKSSENPSVYGDTITLTATVTGGDGTTVPTGSVVFFDAGNSLTAPLDSNGQATFTTNTLTAGTHSITASYDGDDTSVPSTSGAVTEVINKADQTIDFGLLADKVYGAGDFGVSGGASSGLPVTFAIASGPATIAGGTVHITGAGTVTVRASQAGDDNYNAAPPVDRSFTVAMAPQTITFASLSPRTFGDAPFSISATGGGSGNPILFGAVGSCTASGINGTVITITGAGLCIVTATQTGNANYLPATNVSRTLTVNRAAATIAVTGYSGVYDASAHGATGTAAGLRGEDLGSLLDLGASFTDVPGGTAHWTFAGNTDYAMTSGSVGVMITAAPLTVTADSITWEFGAPHLTFTGTLDGVFDSDQITASYSSTGTAMSALGTYPITPALNDLKGRLGNYSVTSHDGVLTIVDTTPPVITSATPSVTSIWPPNKMTVPVSIVMKVSDLADPSPVCLVTGVSSNEGTSEDWAITGPLTVSLRADRNGNGSGRIYTIAIRCTDASGNASTATTTVTVPHDQDR